MILDRTTPPRIHDAVEFDYILPPIHQATLSNGMPLYWLNAGVQDVMQLDWVFPAGLWQEPKPALANSIAGLLKNGTSTRTAQQINEALEFYGANLKVNAGNDYATITLYTLTKHLPHLLPIVYELITDATFPEQEINIHKQNAIQRLLVNLRQCEFVSNQRIDALIFGAQHPYGRFTTKESIASITRENLLAFYKQQYNLANCKMFMAGNVSDKEVKNIEAVFGKVTLTKQEDTQALITKEPATNRKEHIINDANGVQGAIRIGRLFPTRQHPDYAPMVVLNTLFGGYFGSRLMSNIREEKGYTYGIYSSLSPFANEGALTIHTEVGREVIEPAIKEVYREMEILCLEPAEEDELLLVKNYLLGNMLGDLDGPFSILQRWRTLILNGFTIDHFNRNIEIYKNITAPQLQQLAQQYYKAEDFYEVVVI
jgi:predicted Zn-dependent peptidase